MRGLVALTLAALAVVGCVYDRKGALVRLREDNPRVQTSAIHEVEAAGDRTMIPELLDLLGSEDEGVRFMAAAALHQMTGQDFGFQFAKEADRPRVIAKWRRWWEAEAGPSTEGGAPTSPETPQSKAKADRPST